MSPACLSDSGIYRGQESVRGGASDAPGFLGRFVQGFWFSGVTAEAMLRRAPRPL
jgi:hypothetical protein